MKCLILAGGEGSRFNSRKEPKPLIPLLGVPLIERVILTAKKSGVNEFYVVIGHQNAQLRTHLEIFAKKRGISITTLQNDEWKKDNGLSVLKAKHYIDENFILLMCDHICDVSILKRLKNENITEREVILVVDYNIDNNNNVDSVDATKVFVEKNNIVMDIGKKIPHYNAFDTGIFLCSPAIFRGLEESIQKGDTSLSGGIREMTKNMKIRTIDIEDSLWVDIDNERMLKKAEHMLWESIKKQSDGPVMRVVNRPISMRITRYLYKSNLTPNQISFISFLFAIFGACFFLLGGYSNLVVGAIFAQASSVIDGVDGEIARLKCQETKFGAWFDTVLDRYSDAFLLFSLTIYVFRHLTQINSVFILFTGFIAIIGTFMNSYTAFKYEDFEALRGYDFQIGRDVRLFLIFLTGLFNLPFLALLLIALATNGENIRRILVLKQKTLNLHKTVSPPSLTSTMSLKDTSLGIPHSFIKEELSSSE